MSNLLRHRFTSAKADGPDLTQIQPSNWNDGHAFTGGANGDVLTRDTSDATYGAVWSTPEPYWTGIASPPTVLSLPGGLMMYQVLMSNAAPVTIHGAAPASGTFRRGARLRISNIGGSLVTLQNYSATAAVGKFLNFSSGAAATRLAGVSGSSVGGFIDYVWDGGTWLATAHEQGGAIPLTVAVGGVSAQPATLAARYMLRGRDVHVFVDLGNFGTAGAAQVTVTGFPFSWLDSGFRLYAYTNYGPLHQTWELIPLFASGASGFALNYGGAASWPNIPGNLYATIDTTIAIL